MWTPVLVLSTLDRRRCGFLGDSPSFKITSLMGLRLIKNWYSQCLFVHLWENSSKSTEWGVEWAAGHNRHRSTVYVWRLEHLRFATGYLHCQPFSPHSCPSDYQLVQVLKGEDILVYINKSADTTGQCYWNTDFNSEANKCSSHCVTHTCVFSNPEHNWGFTSSLSGCVSC